MLYIQYSTWCFFSLFYFTVAVFLFTSCSLWNPPAAAAVTPGSIMSIWVWVWVWLERRQQTITLQCEIKTICCGIPQSGKIDVCLFTGYIFKVSQVCGFSLKEQLFLFSAVCKHCIQGLYGRTKKRLRIIAASLQLYCVGIVKHSHTPTHLTTHRCAATPLPFSFFQWWKNLFLRTKNLCWNSCDHTIYFRTILYTHLYKTIKSVVLCPTTCVHFTLVSLHVWHEFKDKLLCDGGHSVFDVD